VRDLELAALKRALGATVFALEQALARQAELDREIATVAGPRRLVALLPRPRHLVGDGALGRGLNRPHHHETFADVDVDRETDGV
jgi:hypothetical protein